MTCPSPPNHREAELGFDKCCLAKESRPLNTAGYAELVFGERLQMLVNLRFSYSAKELCLCIGRREALFCIEVEKNNIAGAGSDTRVEGCGRGFLWSLHALMCE